LNLNALYESSDTEIQKFDEAYKNLKKLLIQARLSIKFPTTYLANKEQTDALIVNYINGGQVDDVLNELTILYKDGVKLKTILTKFPIFRKLESARQVWDKIEDLVISQLQEMFAAEWRILNGVTEQVVDEGTYYRGIPGHLLTKDIILDWISHAYDHRAKKKINQNMFSEFNYEFETPRSFISNFHDFVSSAVATTATPTTALLYGVGYKSQWPTANREGWIIEIRTKRNHRVINLAEYKEKHAKYLDEFDFASIRTEDIYAFHHVLKKEKNIIVSETILNPNYKHSSRQELNSFFEEGMQIVDVFQSQSAYYDHNLDYEDIVSTVDIKYPNEGEFKAVTINKNPLREKVKNTKQKDSEGEHEIFMQHYKELYLFARYNDLYRTYEGTENSFFNKGWKLWPEPYRSQFRIKIAALQQELEDHDNEIEEMTSDNYSPEDIFESDHFQEILQIAEKYFKDKELIFKTKEEIGKKRRMSHMPPWFYLFAASSNTPKAQGQYDPKNTNLSFEEYAKITKLISTLKMEINSIWPYPNKDRKKEKVAALEELIKLCESKSVSEALEQIENKDEYKHIREGILSKRVATLLDELKATPAFKLD
jgi:hypothetical protein